MTVAQLRNGFELHERSFDERSDLVARGMSKVSTIDFTNLKRLMESKGGWMCTDCDVTLDDVERLYREFLSLQTAYPDIKLVPTEAIDAFWHSHILDTRAYERDCKTIFGEFLHHYPYFGISGEDDAKNLQSSFEDTCDVWFLHFGRRPDQRAVGHGTSECSRCSSCSRSQ